MGVEPKIGVKPPKWMVKIMENPMNKWTIWGGTPIFGNTQITVTYLKVRFVAEGPRQSSIGAKEVPSKSISLFLDKSFIGKVSLQILVWCCYARSL